MFETRTQKELELARQFFRFCCSFQLLSASFRSLSFPIDSEFAYFTTDCDYCAYLRGVVDDVGWME